mmetsp:Transcript_145665/g.378858  ORF Transcript_145665/g.378858 Transcript_145665/m.378858 type:complete len:118 (+) Transcript_145665:161-514(+)
MLTAEEREQMVELGYTEEEVTEMRVELADAVLKRGTRRPWGDSPMPEAWRDPIRTAAAAGEGMQQPVASDGSSSGEVSQVATVIGLFLGIFAFTAAAVFFTARPVPETIEYTLTSGR